MPHKFCIINLIFRAKILKMLICFVIINSPNFNKTVTVSTKHLFYKSHIFRSSIFHSNAHFVENGNFITIGIAISIFLFNLYRLINLTCHSIKSALFTVNDRLKRIHVVFINKVITYITHFTRNNHEDFQKLFVELIIIHILVIKSKIIN